MARAFVKARYSPKHGSTMSQRMRCKMVGDSGKDADAEAEVIVAYCEGERGVLAVGLCRRKSAALTKRVLCGCCLSL